MGDSLTDSYHQAEVAGRLPGMQVLGAGVPGSGLLDTTVCDGSRASQLRDSFGPDVVIVEYTGN